jgi:hypothetical protein
MSLVKAALEAVLSAIKTDADCAAILRQHVYDVPPPDNARGKADCWLWTGPIGLAPARDIGCGRPMRLRMRLYIGSTDFGRGEAWAAAEAVMAALDGASPLMAAPARWVLPLEILPAGDIVDVLQIRETFVDLAAVIDKT